MDTKGVVRIGRLDADRLRLVIEQQVHVMPPLFVTGHLLIGCAERVDHPAHHVEVEAEAAFAPSTG